MTRDLEFRTRHRKCQYVEYPVQVLIRTHYLRALTEQTDLCRPVERVGKELKIPAEWRVAPETIRDLRPRNWPVSHKSDSDWTMMDYSRQRRRRQCLVIDGTYCWAAATMVTTRTSANDVSGHLCQLSTPTLINYQGSLSLFLLTAIYDCIVSWSPIKAAPKLVSPSTDDAFTAILMSYKIQLAH